MSAPPEVTVSGRPIAALSLAVNYALAPADARDVLTPGGAMPFGTDARYRQNLWGYHALNLLIHLGAALALFGVVRRTLRSPRLRPTLGESATGLAFAVALLWTVHPIQTESVTYIVQRVESLMGLFFLLTLYCAIRALDVDDSSDNGSPHWWSLAAIGSCALGMGSKEVMVVAPLVVALWDFVFLSGMPSEEETRQQRVVLYGGMAATWAILVALVVSETRGQSVGFNLQGWTPWSYLLTQSEVILHYLALAMAPTPLVIDYGWPKETTISAVWPAFAVLSIAVLFTIVAVVRRYPLGFAAAAFFLILAPSSSILPIVTEIAAEHRMYLPLAAVLATVVIGGYALALRWWPALRDSSRARQIAVRYAVIFAGAAAVGLGLLTRERNLDYASQETLWKDAVRKRPANARARITYGLELMRQRRLPEAERELRTAVELDASNAAAQLNLGVVLSSSGKFDEGIIHLERALALEPGDAQTYGNIGEAYAAQRRFAPALKYFLQALESRPDDVFLLNRAGWLLATSGDPDVRSGSRAVELALRAIRVTHGQDVESLDTLAAAYAETGRFSDAMSTAAESVRLARLQGRADILPELEARLRLYQSGQPFRQ